MREFFSKGFLVFGLLAAAGCSSGSSSGDGGADLTPGCVPLPSGSIKWTYEVCGPLKDGTIVDIRQNTVGYVPVSGTKYKQEALGLRTVNKGRVTFTMTNMDWSDFPPDANDVGVMFFMAESAGYSEVNWHMLIQYFIDGDKVQTKLVSQRFDGVCVPSLRVPKCEKVWKDYNMPRYTYSKKYKFDCSWDTLANSMIEVLAGGDGVVDGLARCDVYDATSTSGQTLITTYYTPTSGPYHHLNYFTAGGNSGGQVEKANYPSTLTDFRFTLFQD